MKITVKADFACTCAQQLNRFALYCGYGHLDGNLDRLQQLPDRKDGPVRARAARLRRSAGEASGPGVRAWRPPS
jgi:hypothetical protein